MRTSVLIQDVRAAGRLGHAEDRMLSQRSRTGACRLRHGRGQRPSGTAPSKLSATTASGTTCSRKREASGSVGTIWLFRQVTESLPAGEGPAGACLPPACSPLLLPWPCPACPLTSILHPHLCPETFPQRPQCPGSARPRDTHPRRDPSGTAQHSSLLIKLHPRNASNNSLKEEV